MPRQMADSMVADLCMWGAQRSSNVFVFKCLCLANCVFVFYVMEECRRVDQTFPLGTRETLCLHTCISGLRSSR